MSINEKYKQIKDIGEFAFINRFESKFDQMIKDSDMGIGDDCAVVSINETQNHVITTDLLIEDIHFLKTEISPFELGYKSLAVNLSDIAAMGAKPLYSFLSIGIPTNTDIDYLDRFMEGYHKLSQKYNVPLMGGDTTKSPDKIVINVAVIGISEKENTHLRSMACSGDLVCVTDNLGDSAAGLNILLNKIEQTSVHKKLIKQHHLPEPNILEGMWLAKHKQVHAMMDISDGISSDLKHILKASQKSADIHLDKLPISNELNSIAKKENWNAQEIAASGGEDYKLLFTVDAEGFDKLNADFEKEFNKPLYLIGEINEGRSEISWFKNKQKLAISKMGFDHFS